MKKILIMFMLFLVICSLSVLAEDSLYADGAIHYFVVDDQASVEDVKLLEDLLMSIEFEGITEPDGSITVKKVSQYHASKLNSQVTKKDLENRVTVFIYKGNGLVIIGSTSPANHVKLGTEFKDLLETELNVPTDVTRLSTEITDDDLRKSVIIKSCKDSDNGEDIYEQGYVTVTGGDSTKKDEDYCNGNTLIEFFCSGAASVSSQNLCSNGCEDGRCLPSVSTDESLYADGAIHYFVVDDQASVEDVKLINKFLMSIEFEGILNPDGSVTVKKVSQYHASKLNSEVSKEDLENRVTVFIYKGNGLVIIGSTSPANHVKLGTKFRNLLETELNLPTDVTRLSTEITDDDLRKSVRVKSCEDSDKGENIYKKGYVTLTDGVSVKKEEDYCNGNTLIEYFCDSKKVWESKSSQNLCSYGCKDGACLPFIEEDEEIEITEEEKAESSVECLARSCSIKSEECSGDDKIILEECMIYIQKEGRCDEIITTTSKIIKGYCAKEKTESFVCQGCQLDEKTCLPFGTRIEKKGITYYCDVTKSMKEQKENKQTCQNSYECLSNNCKGGLCSPICEGCLNNDNVCIPFGTRTETQYCDIDYSFKDQKLEDINCNNNYECTTNVCVNNQCISPNLIQKIIMWFKNLFG